MRAQFTFYRSFWDAIKPLKTKEQAEILTAICAYALDDKTPEGLSPVALTVFTLIKPNLDASKRKSDGASGKDKAKIPKG